MSNEPIMQLCEKCLVQTGTSIESPELMGMGSRAASDQNPKDFLDIFPVVGFIVRHPFESLAVAITLIGILGYSAGKSFADGWNSMAGVPPSLFPTDPYETVLRGLSLETPWLYSAVGLTSILIYIWILSCLDAWQEQRNTLVRVRRKSYETRIARRKRYALAVAARAENPKGPAFQIWKDLSARGHWRSIEDARGVKMKRKRRYAKFTASLILQLGCIALLGVGYWAVKASVIKQASVAGIKEYIGIYAAVTGTLPSQFDKKSMLPEELKTLACQGRDELWKFRSVYFDGLDSQKSIGSSSLRSASYILQGTDKVFLLLNSAGSTLHSFGGTTFNLEEANTRPLSVLAKSCP